MAPPGGWRETAQNDETRGARMRRLALILLVVTVAVAGWLPPLFTHGACTAEFDAVSDMLERALALSADGLPLHTPAQPISLGRHIAGVRTFDEQRELRACHSRRPAAISHDIR